MPIQSGQIGLYGVKSTPDINGPHRGIPWRSPALSNAAPTINGRTHDSTGAILPSCTVWAMSTQSDTVMGTTTSDANGLFSLTLYTSGSFYLVAYKTGVAANSAVLPAQISLSRASAGTNFNSSGVLQTASSNTARFDYLYNGSSWVAAGLLIEEQRTQNNTTIDFTNFSAWIEPSGTVVYSSIAAVTGLDGVSSSATSFTVNTNNGPHMRYCPGASIVSVPTGQSVTFSVYIDPSVYTQYAIRESATTGASAVFTLTGSGSVFNTTNAGNFSVSNATVSTVGSLFYRISATFTASSTTNACMGIIMLDGGYVSGDPFSYTFTGDGSSGATYFGPQSELGAAASSLIYPVANAATTRSADIVSSTDATLLAAKGWIVEVGEMQASTAATLLGINTVIGLGATSGNALTTADGGAQTTGNTGTWTSQNRGGLAFDSTPRVSIDLNGGTVVTAANTPAAVTNLYFGNTNNGASGFLNGHIRVLAAYSAITDGQLPGLSTVGASVSTITPTFSIQWAGASSADVSGTTVNTLIPT